ncbi:hypothetical protein ACT691_15015 [Vibrio metschnikovii]
MRVLLGDSGFRGNWREALSVASIAQQVERLQESLTFAIDVLKLALGRSQLALIPLLSARIP